VRLKARSSKFDVVEGSQDTGPVREGGYAPDFSETPHGCLPAAGRSTRESEEGAGSGMLLCREVLGRAIGAPSAEAAAPPALLNRWPRRRSVWGRVAGTNI
jgi:hypothetical protein